MYYRIKNTLEECGIDDIKDRTVPYVALVTKEEFEKNFSVFDMGIDIDMDYTQQPVTRIQVNYDSLTGMFAIPDRTKGEDAHHIFSFAIDERGVVFIDDDGEAGKIISGIKASKKWKFPSLERFIYDFLEGIVKDDLIILENREKELDAMEDSILEGKVDNLMEKLVDIRSEIMDMRIHYEQLIDVAQELEENENNFFNSQNLRFFRLFNERCERLQSIVSSLREHTIMIRDLYNSQMAEKQNKNMAYLTVIATIFTPLTLITGWFGMNFKYMPELNKPWAYPVVAGVCILIAIGSVIVFKIKKWI